MYATMLLLSLLLLRCCSGGGRQMPVRSFVECSRERERSVNATAQRGKAAAPHVWVTETKMTLQQSGLLT